ncbi:MAG: M48 family metallopeptidase [Woeseiaceae bacterium]|nr:M48 family metallopeptidase [Woeseiaceae bacterium]
MRTLRFTPIVLVVAAAVFVSSCASQPSAASRVQMEVEASRAFNQMRASMPLTTDRPTIDFVACVSQSVVDVLEPPYNDIEWELAIFEQEAVNAFAMPGGKIGVFSGILKVTENQHQLAAVIGHEIAHVTAGHTTSRASRDDLTRIGINAVAVILGGGYTGATYTAQQALAYGATFGISLPYKRGQETEADVIGLEYMARAGFDPRQSVPLWQRMAKASGGNAPAEFMSTHPASETRIENLVNQWQKTLPLYNQAQVEGIEPDCGTNPRAVVNIEPAKEKD